MREILFRGKTGFGAWVHGDLIHRQVWKSKFEVIRIDDNGFDNYNEYEVATETIGQFTGLTDKNGKKIFEGDILSTENGTFSNTGMGHILFYKGMWTSFYGQDAIGRDCFDELHTVCNSREVIGNVHDNPELLEVNVNAQ